MKKNALFAVITLIVIILSINSTVLASGRTDPVGEKIRIVNGSREYPAGTPFHIMHGWVQSMEDGAIGIFDFKLEVDGVFSENFSRNFYSASGDPDLLWRLWLYNFEDGFNGTHTFTGHWYAPCDYAVAQLGYSGTCKTPNEKVETDTKTLTITFINNP